jgi:hypothetical protein
LIAFGKEPNAAWTAAELAERLSRTLFATTKELDDLTYLRVFVRRYTPERTTYRLSRRRHVRRAVARLADLGCQPGAAHR